MESIMNPLKKDLADLYHHDKIESAVKLNEQLGGKFFFDNQAPMFFTGNFSAGTVFVMLNPGTAIDDAYSFNKTRKSNFQDYNDFVEKYLYEHQNYGRLDSGRMDNFDLKQAAFLYEFKDSGIDLPDFFAESKGEKAIKLQAKENVLMHKLQLELIPYPSREFKGVLDSSKLAEKNIDILLPFVNRLLDAIVHYDRKYVLFGARQFNTLFEAYKQKGYGNISFFEETSTQIEGLEKRVFCRIMEIEHKGKAFKAIIPYTFPRQDLPNAYEKMRQYGKFCYETYLKN